MHVLARQVTTVQLALPTHRLSPKNQVTLPRDARSLLGVGEGGVVCALPRRALHEDAAKRFPIVTLLTLDELTRREAKLRDDFKSEPTRQFRLLQVLNEGVRQMTVDAQRRVVLPNHFVEHIGIDRDLAFICSNDSVQVWNPVHYVAWRGEVVEGADSALDALLF